MAHEVGLQAVLGHRGRGEGLRRRKLRAAAQQEDELGAGCWFGQLAAGLQLLGTEDDGCGRRRLLEELLSSGTWATGIWRGGGMAGAIWLGGMDPDGDLVEWRRGWEDGTGP